VADEQQANHTAKLRDAYTRRLYALELRQAEQGVQTDPAVENEIADIRKKVAELAMVDTKPPAARVTRAVRARYGDDILEYLITQFAEVKADIAGVKADARSVRDETSHWRGDHTRKHSREAVIGLVWLIMILVVLVFILVKVF
jgi:hypothetical protein